MSAQQPTTAAPPPGCANGHADSDTGIDGLGPIEGATAGAPALPLATAELANLLAHGQWSETAHVANPDFADIHAYDGHVALALDAGVLPDIDSTLDLLTSSHHLFDVPALDVSSFSDDASST